ncbi:hypothetical protein [Alterisphingorhabdus coralli]|uniref:Uncharacterized protein n=1 Tax=Alterisphingorhabdus coralli TaxID=3071408 RepID=A0AA97I1T5_9SPHN|nr:hypothetical protein [Parasphingorhabdus sp. SCSIO 66989]WOE75630.1 hypothetical protein RB602_02640 [Parasphingorhabdus sp. SCSIO 66989]
MTDPVSPERPAISYAQLLETNQLIQACADSTYWLCLTRTVQGSKLYPVSAYILLSYLNAFYRYPSLIRKVEASMPAEEIADRARQMGVKAQNSSIGWALPSFYLLGREYLINLGFLRPQDAIEDVITVMDFWKRFQLSWHRNDGHLTNADYNQRAQILPHSAVQRFAGEMHKVEPGGALSVAAQRFLATVSQYGFLVSAESRISLTNSGPYRLTDDSQLLMRDFMDLGETSLPWLDDIASDMPFNNLTVAMEVTGCHFHLVDDWGSFESTPEFTPDRLTGIGLYTSDTLSEGHVPVGMDTPETLTAMLDDLSDRAKAATDKLWLRMAEWSRDQLIDAGALSYYAICKEIAHIAGVFDPADWLEIDPRAERFRPLLSDEYADTALGELVGGLTLPSQQTAPHGMMKWSDKPTRVLTPLPLSVLNGAPFLPRMAPPMPGGSHLPAKNDRYQTTRGVLSLAQYNEAARAFVPKSCRPEENFRCETARAYPGCDR